MNSPGAYMGGKYPIRVPVSFVEHRSVTKNATAIIGLISIIYPPAPAASQMESDMPPTHN